MNLKTIFKRKDGVERRSASEKIVFSIAFILFLLYSLFVLFFFVFALVIALKENQIQFTQDQINNKLFTFTAHPNFRNFLDAFSELNTFDKNATFLSTTWNSIWRTVGSSALSIMSSAMVCYVLVFYKTKFTKLIYNVGLFVAILPLYGSAGATYRLYNNLGIINNPLILVVSISLYGGYFFYMYAFFKALSWEYAEAAFMDGANHFQVFFKIMFPMVLPSVAALFVLSFIAGWNDYESTLLYMRKYPNLSYAIYAYSSISKYNANEPAYFAGVLIALLPSLLLFSIFQNTIMEKVYMGGLKG